VLAAFKLSVTVRLTEYVPADVYVCDGLARFEVVPSPKFHEYEEIVPSKSQLLDELKLIIRFELEFVQKALGPLFTDELKY
jgi:hypothetical protein